MLKPFEAENVYQPSLLDLKNTRDSTLFHDLIRADPATLILDQFASQKKELFKIQNPRTRLSQNELDKLFEDWQKGLDLEKEGIWVYYPWSKKMIHVLDRDEFITLRTSRNQHKISKQEQDQLLDKKIGIIGLSVGSAVALSIATERTCGKLKLADFDVIELSNLNRIKTGIQNIGLNKCIVTAREIAEIDPYIEIECFTEGITQENIHDFMTGGGKLDILIDECDDIGIKLLCRLIGKELSIPVVMETSDRGMLDVERFDLEIDRPIFHGLLHDIPETKLRDLTPQDRLPMVMKIVDVMNSSYRARLSLLEIGQTITTWPQLASAVSLGGAVVTDTCRRMLLNQFNASGRFYVDLEQIVSVPVSSEAKSSPNTTTSTFDLAGSLRIADSLLPGDQSIDPGVEIIEKIVEAGSKAPSSGNSQPWKWLYRNGTLHLFHDISRSSSFSNFNNSAANMALGAAYENAVLKAGQLGFLVKTDFSSTDNAVPTVSMQFLPRPEDAFTYGSDLADSIYTRSTNRNIGLGVPLSEQDYKILKDTAESVPGVQLRFLTDPGDISDIASLIGKSDLIFLLNNQGHDEFFEKNITWPAGAPGTSYEGISPLLLGMNGAQLAALAMLRDKKVAQALRHIGGGNSFVESTINSIKSASCLALISMPRNTPNKFFNGGIAAQRLWLRAEQLGLAVQPLNSALSLFARLESGEGLEADELEKIIHLRKLFRSIVNLDEKLDEIFLIKIARAEVSDVKTPRLPLNEILFMANDAI